MGHWVIDQIPTDHDVNQQGEGGSATRQQWVRANFSQIFGTSAADLAAQGIDPRQYARAHRDEIRSFAQAQRRQGIAVPDGRPSGANGPGGYGPGGPRSRYGGGSRYGTGFRGAAWIGVLLALFVLRFILVDSFAGRHAAIFWVLGIGGIMLVARVLLFSWLRRRRASRRQ